MKDKFVEIYNENIKREGAERLLDWLLRSDFFTAPASTKYHGSHEGGLCEHSVNVYNRLIGNVAMKDIEASAESLAVVALLHDVCKANFYKVEMKNKKNQSGEWIQEAYYTVDDQLPFGHGEKSQYIISAFIKLSREESMAIRWHMGESSNAYPGLSAQAFRQYPLALMLHISDLEATFIDEKAEGK